MRIAANGCSVKVCPAARYDRQTLHYQRTPGRTRQLEGRSQRRRSQRNHLTAGRNEKQSTKTRTTRHQSRSRGLGRKRPKTMRRVSKPTRIPSPHHTTNKNPHRDEWSHGPFESCGEDTWTFGITPARAADLGIATEDLQTSSKTCKLPDTGSLKCQKPDPIRHELPGRVIIGAKLTNRYADPREGGKWKRVGGWLGRETFSVKVETRHTRGCDWEFVVWSVPRSLYEGES